MDINIFYVPQFILYVLPKKYQKCIFMLMLLRVSLLYIKLESTYFERKYNICYEKNNVEF